MGQAAKKPIPIPLYNIEMSMLCVFSLQIYKNIDKNLLLALKNCNFTLKFFTKLHTL